MTERATYQRSTFDSAWVRRRAREVADLLRGELKTQSSSDPQIRFWELDRIEEEGWVSVGRSLQQARWTEGYGLLLSEDGELYQGSFSGGGDDFFHWTGLHLASDEDLVSVDRRNTGRWVSAEPREYEVDREVLEYSGLVTAAWCGQMVVKALSALGNPTDLQARKEAMDRKINDRAAVAARIARRARPIKRDFAHFAFYLIGAQLAAIAAALIGSVVGAIYTAYYVKHASNWPAAVAVFGLYISAAIYVAVQFRRRLPLRWSLVLVPIGVVLSYYPIFTSIWGRPW